MALGAEVVDFIRTQIIEKFCHLGRIGQISVVKEEPCSVDVGVGIEMINTAGIEGGSTSDDAVDLVSLLKQQFSEIGAILSSDAGDESFFHRAGKPTTGDIAE